MLLLLIAAFAGAGPWRGYDSRVQDCSVTAICAYGKAVGLLLSLDIKIDPVRRYTITKAGAKESKQLLILG